MLQEGRITSRNSPFSSPVGCPCEKKDGTWRFCIDYRVLNVIIIDSFPVLTVDELINELYHAKNIFKLDLQSGYPGYRQTFIKQRGLLQDHF